MSGLAKLMIGYQENYSSAEELFIQFYEIEVQYPKCMNRLSVHIKVGDEQVGKENIWVKELLASCEN